MRKQIAQPSEGEADGDGGGDVCGSARPIDFLHQLKRLEAEGGEATAKAGDDEQGDGCFALIGIPETGCEADDQ